MARHSYSRSFAQGFILWTFLVLFQVTGKESCNPNKCPGPLRYYKDLGCKPVYKHSGDCCPESYNCDHLKNLRKDRCYMNGHEYKDGEKLREEDRNRCDVGCFCSASPPYDPMFNCAIVDCFFPNPETNCYLRPSPTFCCGDVICPKEGEVKATCKVDGKIYEDGELFKPKSDPELICFCQPGYKGKNVEPFCKKPGRSECSPFLTNIGLVNKKCAPVYDVNENPRKDCPATNNYYRCEEENDVIIRNNNGSHSAGEKICKLGSLKMHKGDILKGGKNSDSGNVKCVCEVPPVPTCKLVIQHRTNLDVRNVEDALWISNFWEREFEHSRNWRLSAIGKLGFFFMNYFGI